MRVKYEVTNEPFLYWLKRKRFNIIEFRKKNFDRIIKLLKENNQWKEEAPGLFDDFCYDFYNLTRNYYQKWWENIGFLGAPNFFIWNEEKGFCSFLEFKSKNDELRSPQIEWLIKNKGLPYMVFRGLNDKGHLSLKEIIRKSEILDKNNKEITRGEES